MHLFKLLFPDMQFINSHTYFKYILKSAYNYTIVSADASISRVYAAFS